MTVHRFFRQFLLALLLTLVVSVCVFAQAPPDNKEYEPIAGQSGKDVIWLPTAQALAEKMLNLAQVTPRDYLIDLGSGDGRIVITAAKRGARAHGIEYNPDMVELSKRNAAREGVADKATFVKADLYESDFSAATVITMFLLPEINMKLRPAILDLKPGTRIVSNSFDMGDWKADQAVTVSKEEGCDNNYCEAFLWIVPAKVEGRWKFRRMNC
jgi:precorrin-6B methylase 2